MSQEPIGMFFLTQDEFNGLIDDRIETLIGDLHRMSRQLYGDELDYNDVHKMANDVLLKMAALKNELESVAKKCGGAR